MPPVFIYNMPAVNPNNPSQGGPQRTSFRPPWVKEGPTPLPMPSAPWTARTREGTAAAPEEPKKAEKPGPRKLSKVTIIPSLPPQESNVQEGPGQSTTGRKDSTTTVQVVVESRRKPSAEKVVPISVEQSGPRDRRKESIVKIKEEPETVPRKAAREFAKPVPKPVDKELPKSILKDPSKTSVSSIPKPPPAPPMAPPLPPPPPPGFVKSEMTVEKAAKLEQLRSRARRRPDWTDMMKEVENGKKLKHIVCNDRSAPVLPKDAVKGKFIYESEKEKKHDPHKQLLNEIQSGVRLKKVKTNDRSRPNLDGLRKFRRQMTIEEQIQKSMSMADVVALAAEPDELDDIDKVRDDLQSSKQMLAQELRNKEALERENKRLMARLLNMEVELEKEKDAKRIESEKGQITGQVRSAADEKLVQQLKEEASEANRVAKEMEDKYRGTAEELDATRAKLESAWLRNQQLEHELKAAGGRPITKQPSSKKLAASSANIPNGRTMTAVSDDESEYTEETETETETEEEEEGNEADAAAAQERRVARELKLLATKLRSFKEKQGTALKERHSLREQLRKQQKTLRQEKKKYKALQKEVDKMAKLMKDDEEEEEEEEEEEKQEQLDEEETESESESEESEEEELTDGDLPEDAPVEDRRKNLTDRAKHHENRLGTLKKGNYLLKANIDRLQDDINRQREMSLSLQEDLNSVLAELG